MNLLQKSRKTFFYKSFLINSPNSSQNSTIADAGHFDFYRMIVTVMETSFQRLPPKVRHYMDCSNFDNNIFRDSLFNELSKLNVEIVDLQKFVTVCIDILNS